MRTKPAAERGRDLETTVSLSFEQAVEGAQVPVSVATHAACGTCRGTGARPGTAPSVCPVCQGRGVESQGQGLFSITRPCARCGGSGTVIEEPCPTCAGQGRLRELKKYRVNIPAGVKEGSRIRLPGKGEAGLRGGPAGDLFVITHVAESPVFERKGDNLEVEVPITIAEAVRGADVEVPTLHGTKKLRVPGGTKHGTVQRLRGEGPPLLGKGSQRGDIHYRFVIDVPRDLSDEQREAVEALSKSMNGNPRERLMREARADHRRRGLMAARRTRVTAKVATNRGVFMISVAAELAEMHPQTLRMYEARGLIEPQRSPEGHAPVLPGRRRAAAPDPGDDHGVGHEPGRRRARARARGEAQPHAPQGRGARGARRRRCRARSRASRRSSAPSRPRSCATRRRGRR